MDVTTVKLPLDWTTIKYYSTYRAELLKLRYNHVKTVRKTYKLIKTIIIIKVI